MDKEKNIEAIDKEFQAVRDELKELLVDIRVHLMDAQSPVSNDLEKEQPKEELEL